MPARPLLILPTPSLASPPPGDARGTKLRFPSRGRQTGQFGPLFTQLRNVLNRQGGALELRDDPSSLAPDRVIVFEIAGTITDFLKAVARIDGLEFMAEYETDFPADEHFAVQDKRKGREGQDREDKSVSGRFYLAMPNTRALEELVRLWDRWQAGQALGTGYAPFCSFVPAASCTSTMGSAGPHSRRDGLILARRGGAQSQSASAHRSRDYGFETTRAVAALHRGLSERS